MSAESTSLLATALVVGLNIVLAVLLIGRPVLRRNRNAVHQHPASDSFVIERLEQDRCDLCHNPITENDDLVVCSSCQTIYHRECADAMVLIDSRCVNCGAEIAAHPNTKR